MNKTNPLFIILRIFIFDKKKETTLVVSHKGVCYQAGGESQSNSIRFFKNYDKRLKKRA